MKCTIYKIYYILYTIVNRLYNIYCIYYIIYCKFVKLFLHSMHYILYNILTKQAAKVGIVQACQQSHCWSSGQRNQKLPIGPNGDNNPLYLACRYGQVRYCTVLYRTCRPGTSQKKKTVSQWYRIVPLYCTVPTVPIGEVPVPGTTMFESIGLCKDQKNLVC